MNKQGDFEVLPLSDKERLKRLETIVAALQREIANIKRDKWGE